MNTFIVLVLALVACAAANNEFTCKYNKHGTSYRGKVSTTKSGHTCQRWDSQTPNAHDFAWPRLYPEDTVEEAENYCRNPNHYKKKEGPWCFTNTPGVKWEYCDIPYCQEEECKTHIRGMAYTGDVSVTKSGRTCQRWDSQEPHAHSQTDLADFPDASLADTGNFCRNPKDKENGPWCYTTDANKKWEYCDVAVCPPPATENGGDIICKLTGTGQTYRGTLNQTKNGLDCQRWDTQAPHSHTRNNDVMFPDATVSEAENYCRNPDDEPFGPWCYTTDPNTRWNYCDVPDCSDIICQDHFEKYVDTHAEGGNPYPQYDHSVDVCLAACLEEPECNAVDFHHGNNVWQETRCWFHTVYYMKEFEVEGADMYRRVGCAAPDYACTSQFELTENYHAEEGVSRDGSTLEECRAACLSEGHKCIAFDWDHSDEPWQGHRCWLHMDVINLEPEVDTDHYPRIRCSECM